MALYCQICDMKFNSEVDEQTHLNGKKHKSAEKRRGFHNKEEASAARKIYVSRIGGLREPKESKLKYYFSSFGSVKYIKILHNAGSAILEFNQPESVVAALAVHHHVCTGHIINVKEYKRTEPMRQTDENAEMKSQEKMMGILMSAVDLDDQMNRLAEELSLPARDLEQRMKICHDLTNIFSPYFNSCQIYQFGSSINGFGTVGCDLDLFILINDDKTVVKKPQIALPYHKDLSEFLQTLTHGPLSNDHLKEIKLYDLIKLMSRIMTSRQTDFSEVISIPSSHCPLLRFGHKPTRIQCDLTLNNSLALYNSRLLRLYSTSPRVHRVVSTVRRWSKAQALSATPRFSHLLSSYSLTWMVLFYLQSESPPVIPAVGQIVAEIPGAENIEIQGHQCISVPPDAVLPSDWSSNTMTSAELLRGFFLYYTSKVNLETEALLTRDLRIVAKEEIPKLPGYENIVKENHMTVVDPFNLSHNVTRNINEKARDRLLVQMQMATQLIGEKCHPEKRLRPWGLVDLLTAQKDPPSFSVTVNKKQRKIQASLDAEGPPVLSFILNPPEPSASSNQQLGLKQKDKDTERSPKDHTTKTWIEKYTDLLRKLLVEAFLVHIPEDIDIEEPSGLLSHELDSRAKDNEQFTNGSKSLHIQEDITDEPPGLLSQEMNSEEKENKQFTNSSNVCPESTKNEDTVSSYEPKKCRKRASCELDEDENVEDQRHRRFRDVDPPESEKDSPNFSCVMDCSPSERIISEQTCENSVNGDKSCPLAKMSGSPGCDPMNHSTETVVLDNDECIVKPDSPEMSTNIVENMVVMKVEDKPSSSTDDMSTNQSSVVDQAKQKSQCSKWEKGEVGELFSLSGLVSLIVWRDRTKAKKNIRRQDPHCSGVFLERMVTLGYLKEQVSEENITAELEAKIRDELNKPNPDLSFLDDSCINGQKVWFDLRVRKIVQPDSCENKKTSQSEEISKPGCSDQPSDVSNPTEHQSTTVSTDSEKAQGLEQTSSSVVLRVEARPRLTTAVELNYFQLFFDSFRQTLQCLRKIL